MAERPWQDKEKLVQKYKEEGKSILTIADEWDCSIGTISRWLDKFDIETRTKGVPSEHVVKTKDKENKHRNEEWLRAQYWDNEKTLEEMAEMAETSVGVLLKHMDRHGIDRRPSSTYNKYAYFRTNNHGHELWESWTESGGSRYMLVHRLQAVAYHGVDAVKDKHVHHKNHIPWDNRPENLEVLSVSEHRSYHAKEMGLSEMGAAATRQD